MWREANMTRKLFQATVSKGFAVLTVTLIAALALAPGAWAAGKYNVLYNFTGGADGGGPYEGLVTDTTGNLYSTTTLGGASGNGTVFKLTKNSDGSWTESVLYSFAGGADGATPWAAVTFDTSGNLYGTTTAGGTSSAGTVFKLAPNSNGTWTESVLYSFTGGSDGAYPQWCGVILDASGTLYGMTSGGGSQDMGVVYKLTPNSGGSWTYSLLHTFTGGKDGSYPQVGILAFNTAGKLYGTTSDGVDNYGECPTRHDCGSIFEMTPQSDGSWKEQVIFRFTGVGTGRRPDGTLSFDSAGRLYGAAAGGGGILGTAFRLTLGAKGKWNEQVLHVFQGNQDGAYPASGVVFDTVGNLYGSTFYGEDENGGCCFGQVFKLIPHSNRWDYRAVHRFHGPPQDGSNTNAGVVFDTAGNLYSTAQNGGTSGYGVVFEFTP
jgi:uncharacterized repeat protein (TIGR03803 family)